MYSFTKTMEQLKTLQGSKTVFYGSEILNTVWETKPEILAKLLPAPLKPVKGKPLVSTFVGNYPKTSFAPGYKEAGLFILAQCDGVIGRYCLSMPITDGMAMSMGREVCGLPKKMANIDFEVKDGKAVGKISRNGIEFFTVNADISGSLNKEGKVEELNEAISEYMYNITYAKSADGCGFLLNPTLIKQKLAVAQVTEDKLATSTVVLKDSPHDPWAELEVVRMVGSQYTVSTNTLEPGENLYFNKIDPMGFVPYSFTKWDWWAK
ncbi:acetoacetate decarboxylase family protein [Clostridium estertheticum]|uniref:acetoacetate decarboxylase family protein n=1 Tax=Clostridium estertheticum TaxID=238834 RepID=UPI001C6EF288|nr:acetoacetate decarboxylase family protein [Clostridium estertheticum]MBW9154209.1 acetoacetate decarboxylase family protein [Clostridium estertheticum]WLC85229.1 acetoacetate decarboxylase family protein [Clostridium estertheticum]